MPTFGSLFAGIGGIDLGLERAGWECRFQVEWDDYCQRVLAKHWPDVPRYGDITAVDWSGVDRVDLLAGGFPCQPFSNAGRRRGVDDERWLWPEFARAIRELRPGLVLVENVPGLLAGHGGMGRVLGDLADLGYDADWDSIPAAALGAPHLRYRVWIVAHAQGGGWSWRWGGDEGRDSATERSHGRTEPPRSGAARRAINVANSYLARLEGHGGGSREGRDPGEQPARAGGASLPDSDSQRWIGRAGEQRPGWWREPSDGSWWLTEPDVGRVAHGVPSRVDRLRALGNAVVPQVVEVIGRRLMEAYEHAA